MATGMGCPPSRPPPQHAGNTVPEADELAVRERRPLRVGPVHRDGPLHAPRQLQRAGGPSGAPVHPGGRCRWRRDGDATPANSMASVSTGTSPPAREVVNRGDCRLGVYSLACHVTKPRWGGGCWQVRSCLRLAGGLNVTCKCRGCLVHRSQPETRGWTCCVPATPASHSTAPPTL